MEEKYLMDICNPKQWKTIPKSELIEDGEFPVLWSQWNNRKI